MKKAFLLFFFATATTFALAQAPAAAKDSINLTEYVGVYKYSEMLNQAAVTLKDGFLVGEVDSYGSYKLLPQKEADTFQSTSSYGTVYVFQRDAAKKVVALKLQLMGQELVGSKQ